MASRFRCSFFLKNVGQVRKVPDGARVLDVEARTHPVNRALRLMVMLTAAIVLSILNSPPVNRARTEQAQIPLTTEEAYFQFDYPPYPETFIFKLTDLGKIEEARAIVSGQKSNRHVMGIVMQRPVGYNLPWSYHLDPASITFFDFALEVCDATIRYVEDHLDEACGAFLPGCTWCPWGSRLIAEVKLTPTPTPSLTPTPTSTPTPTATHTPSITPTPVAIMYLPVVLREFR